MKDIRNQPSRPPQKENTMIVLKANYSKKPGCPGLSSHLDSLTVRLRPSSVPKGRGKHQTNGRTLMAQPIVVSLFDYSCNIPSLLSHRQIDHVTGATVGAWSLLNDEIAAYHTTPKNIEFTVIIVNDTQRCLRVNAKINRRTKKLSNVEVNEI